MPYDVSAEESALYNNNVADTGNDYGGLFDWTNSPSGGSSSPRSDGGGTNWGALLGGVFTAAGGAYSAKEANDLAKEKARLESARLARGQVPPGQPSGNKNKLFLYIGIGVAVVAGLFLMFRKK